DAGKLQAGLRLDDRNSATMPLESGAVAIVAGQPDKSELVRRLRAGGDERMPPEETGMHLSEAQKQIIERWIAAGADYAAHWSFVTPTRPPLPPGGFGPWPRDPVDVFVLARLQEVGIAPSPEADRAKLLRRVTVD